MLAVLLGLKYVDSICLKRSLLSARPITVQHKSANKHQNADALSVGYIIHSNDKGNSSIELGIGNNDDDCRLIMLIFRINVHITLLL